jgi:hypothetical protein
MIALSYWSNRNPIKARFFILFAHLWFGFGGLTFGLWLYAEGFALPLALFGVLLLFFSGAYVGYPVRKTIFVENPAEQQLFRRRRYLRQKTADGVLILSLACMWVVAGNRLPLQFTEPISQGQIPGPTAQGSLALTDQGSKVQKWLSRAETLRIRVPKQIQNRLQNRLNAYTEGRKQGDKTPALVGIVLLGIFLSFWIAYFAVFAACGLSCNGNDLAAILVLIAGIGLLVLLWILSVKWMRKVKAKNKIS